MAIVSRLQLNHPALGTTGGAALHASIESLYQKIGDSISSRWFAIADFDNGETVDLKHDFSTDMSNIRYDIYVQVAGEWVVLTNESSPARSAFTVVEKSGAEGSTLQITNVSGGNNLEAAVALVNDPLYLQQGDIKDVDITGAEDGQALVYQSSSKKFVPGASGDSSFKLQSISTPNAVIKGGYILLQDGRELATHDGSGSLQADFGQDLTINLTTVLGSSPADATTYYLYVDLHSLSASVTTTDTGRVLYAVTQSNFKLLTSKPELVDQARYIPRGLIRSATTGTAWSGAGSYFATLAFLGAKGEAEDNLLVKVNKPTHGLTANDLGTPMYLLGGTYTAARADSSDMAEVVGLVHSIVDTNYFNLAIGGEVPLTTTVTGGESITAGKVFFLSPTTAGRLTATEPTVVGHVSKPIGIVLGNGQIAFYNYRGSVVGASNVRTQISLANNATTTVQDVSAYEAGELTGWVSIAATTPLKFYVAAQFSKNGAGNNYNISYQTSGDAPPAGFLVQVTAAGLVQIVMPSVTGFASASINYALNAPAVGATLPLSISARAVLGDTSGTAVPAGYVGEVKTISQPSNTNFPASDVYSDIGSFQLTPGIWVLSASIMYSMDNDVTAFQYGTFGFSTTSGNSYPDQLADMSNCNYLPRGLGRAADNAVIFGTSIPCFYVNISALTTYYLKITPGTYSGTAPTYRANAKAIRIA